MALFPGLRRIWVKMDQSLMCPTRSKPALGTFRWGNMHFHVSVTSYLIQGDSLSHGLNLDLTACKMQVSFAVSSWSVSLWQQLRTTWRSWVRIWRPQKRCAALCSRATRSTALTSSARKQRSSSCRPATQTWPTSWMRGENHTADFSLKSTIRLGPNLGVTG